jgi:hypothetical protein
MLSESMHNLEERTNSKDAHLRWEIGRSAFVASYRPSLIVEVNRIGFVGYRWDMENSLANRKTSG